MCSEPVAGSSPAELVRIHSAPMIWSAAATTVPPFTAPLGLGVRVERSMRKTADSTLNSTHCRPRSRQYGNALAQVNQSAVSSDTGYHHVVSDETSSSDIVSSGFLVPRSEM